MKKSIVIFSVCVLLLISIPLSACSSNSADIESLKTQIAELQKENSELKSEIDNNPKSESSESSKSESSKSETQKIPDKTKSEYDFITVEVISIEKINKNTDNYVFSDRVNFEFDITNLGTKSVKGISGILIIKDMFDKEIIKYNVDFTQDTIPPNKILTVRDLGVDINPFIDSNVKFFTSSKESLKFEYIVEKVVY